MRWLDKHGNVDVRVDKLGFLLALLVDLQLVDHASDAGAFAGARGAADDQGRLSAVFDALVQEVAHFAKLIVTVVEAALRRRIKIVLHLRQLVGLRPFSSPGGPASSWLVLRRRVVAGGERALINALREGREVVVQVDWFRYQVARFQHQGRWRG